MKCPLCGLEAVLKDSAILHHGRSYGPAWVCPGWPKCPCYVGCHKGTEKPLGNLATPKMRIWRKAAHSILDELWKPDKKKRGKVYAALARHLAVREIHVGQSDVETCKKIIEWARQQFTK